MSATWYGILALIMWSAGSLMVALLHNIPAFEILTAAFFMGFLLLTAGQIVRPDPESLIVLFILGLTRISYSFWDYAMKKGDVMLLTSLSYFLPLASTLLLILFGFIPDRPIIAFGAILIIAGCLLVNVDKLFLFFRKLKKT